MRSFDVHFCISKVFPGGGGGLLWAVTWMLWECICMLWERFGMLWGEICMLWECIWVL